MNTSLFSLGRTRNFLLDKKTTLDSTIKAFRLCQRCYKPFKCKVRKRVSRTLCPTFPGMRVSAQRGASPKEKDTVTSARPTYRRHRSVCTSQCPSAAVPRSTLRCCREKKKNKKRKKKRGNQYLDRSLCAVGHQMKMRGNTSHSSRRALKANLENRESSVAEILCSSFIRRLSPR